MLLSGSVAAFSRAFGVELNRYEHPTGSCRMRSGSIQIPAALSGIIEGVFGLDNRPQAKAHFRIRKQSRTPRPLTRPALPTTPRKSRKPTISPPEPTAADKPSASWN